eukprot:RCo043272
MLGSRSGRVLRGEDRPWGPPIPVRKACPLLALGGDIKDEDEVEGVAPSPVCNVRPLPSRSLGGDIDDNDEEDDEEELATTPPFRGGGCGVRTAPGPDPTPPTPSGPRWLFRTEDGVVAAEDSRADATSEGLGFAGPPGAEARRFGELGESWSSRYVTGNWQNDTLREMGPCCTSNSSCSCSVCTECSRRARRLLRRGDACLSEPLTGDSEDSETDDEVATAGLRLEEEPASEVRSSVAPLGNDTRRGAPVWLRADTGGVGSFTESALALQMLAPEGTATSSSTEAVRLADSRGTAKPGDSPGVGA